MVSDHLYRGTKALVAYLGMTHVAEADAGMLEEVRVVEGGFHISGADGRYYWHASRAVWACSDECERHLLHGAGLDESTAGMR